MDAKDFSVKQMEYRELAKQTFPLLKSTKKEYSILNLNNK
jgi:hypothetical protein